jgi:hypothetical protein
MEGSVKRQVGETKSLIGRYNCDDLYETKDTERTIYVVDRLRGESLGS